MGLSLSKDSNLLNMLSTEKRAWNHEIMAILSRTSGKLRILAPKIRTKCVPNKTFLNFMTFL